MQVAQRIQTSAFFEGQTFFIVLWLPMSIFFLVIPAKAGIYLHLFWIPASAEILMIQFILHWQFLLKPEIEFKIIEPWDRWFYPL